MWFSLAFMAVRFEAETEPHSLRAVVQEGTACCDSPRSVSMSIDAWKGVDRVAVAMICDGALALPVPTVGSAGGTEVVTDVCHVPRAPSHGNLRAQTVDQRTFPREVPWRD